METNSSGDELLKTSSKETKSRGTILHIFILFGVMILTVLEQLNT